MNIYARYFDQDTLVYSFDELVDFLSSIPDIRLTQDMVEDIKAYVEGDMPYPKRYKIRPRVYFILIKTNAPTLADFKANRKNQNAPNAQDGEPFAKKDYRVSQLQEEHPGWYKASILFKRVIPIPGTNKFQYQDTTFSACVRTSSAMECYNRIIEHLRGRRDIDPRSQFPSAKGQNYQYTFMGDKLPADIAVQG